MTSERIETTTRVLLFALDLVDTGDPSGKDFPIEEKEADPPHALLGFGIMSVFLLDLTEEEKITHIPTMFKACQVY
ncbi:jg16279 [Pararge aegeria aegeria]|uniref:Jg16279 protein n=1 Tax=Pararge aegeria aegeria TaxID=348720 RepID=A0A8S4RW53_9NEOP|nr:jg16279 [Pararge aegeria aegeria]